MNFEYDESKNRINLKKHNIGFTEAQKIWEDEQMLEVVLDFPDETRYMCIGRIASRHWTAIVTYRGKTVRIISVRRSRKKEIEHYENG